jgi:hypothetical protein
MQIPSWLLIVAALVTAVPFGFLLGLIAAYVKAGSNVGMLPIITIRRRSWPGSCSRWCRS